MAEILNAEDYKQILQNRFNDNSIKFVQADVKPISEHTEGFTGEHYQIIITYEKNGTKGTEPFFMKTKSKEVIRFESTTPTNIYNREIFHYSVLHKEFRKYGYDVSFAGLSFHFIPNQTIVMQDMTKLGYQIPERGQYLNDVELKCLLKSLALYHGAGFAYEQTKSKELSRFFSIDQEWPGNLNEPLFLGSSSKLKLFWESNLLSFHNLIDLLPEDESYRNEFHQMLKTYDMQEPFLKETNLARICGHGDLWSNNFLFKHENGVPIKCCLIDFQTARYFYPSFDVLLAIYCNTSSEFRTKYLTTMYQYYYDTLSKIVHNYGHSLQNIMPLSDFQSSMKFVKVNVMLQYLLTMSVAFLPKEKLTKSVNDGNWENFILKNKEELNKNAFNTDNKFRKATTDALHDLREALIEYRSNFS